MTFLVAHNSLGLSAKEIISMSTESNTAVARSLHNAFYAGSLDGVDELTTEDTVWASKILE